MSVFPVMCVRTGQCVAFPDVCFTPAAPSPIPMPYPNIAIPADGDGSDKVKTMAANTLRKGDKMTKSTADNAGSAPGGTVSGMMMGAVEVKTGSNKVKAEGKEVAYHTIMTAHNGNNANAPAGGHLAPTQMKVKVIGTPGCPGSGLDALKAGGFIATGAVATGINSGDPITNAQQSLRCTPTTQANLAQQGNSNPAFNVNYGPGQATSFDGASNVTIGAGHPAAASPAGLVGLISHELGHAMGPSPSTTPLPGETSAAAYGARMKDEFLRDEGRAAMSNIRARQESQANCPGQAAPPVIGEPAGANWEQTAANAGSPQAAEQALGQQFGNLTPSTAPTMNYTQYYQQGYYNYGVSNFGLTP